MSQEIYFREDTKDAVIKLTADVEAALKAQGHEVKEGRIGGKRVYSITTIASGYGWHTKTIAVVQITPDRPHERVRTYRPKKNGSYNIKGIVKAISEELAARKAAKERRSQATASLDANRDMVNSVNAELGLPEMTYGSTLHKNLRIESHTYGASVTLILSGIKDEARYREVIQKLIDSGLVES